MENDMKLIEFKCPSKNKEGVACGNKWVPRVPNPKKCPKCGHAIRKGK